MRSLAAPTYPNTQPLQRIRTKNDTRKNYSPPPRPHQRQRIVHTHSYNNTPVVREITTYAAIFSRRVASRPRTHCVPESANLTHLFSSNKFVSPVSNHRLQYPPPPPPPTLPRPPTPLPRFDEALEPPKMIKYEQPPTPPLPPAPY